ERLHVRGADGKNPRSIPCRRLSGSATPTARPTTLAAEVTTDSVRLEELSTLLEVPARLHEDVLAVCGERGSGKTQLLASAARRVETPCHLVRANRTEAEWRFSGLSSILTAMDEPSLDDFVNSF